MYLSEIWFFNITDFISVISFSIPEFHDFIIILELSNNAPGKAIQIIYCPGKLVILSCPVDSFESINLFDCPLSPFAIVGAL